MSQLTLHPGPRLMHQRSGETTSQDVSEHAIAYLFDRLELAPDLRFRDFMALFGRCPELQAVYRRLFAYELCELTDFGAAPCTEDSGFVALELRQGWFLNTSTQTYSETRRFDMVGLSQPSDASEFDFEYPDGLRRYSLLGYDIRVLLDLPVRVPDSVPIYESESGNYGGQHRGTSVHCQDMTLGDLLHAMLWDLTWFGTPDTTEEVVNKLAAAHNDPTAWSGPMTADESMAVLDAEMEKEKARRARAAS